MNIGFLYENMNECCSSLHECCYFREIIFYVAKKISDHISDVILSNWKKDINFTGHMVRGFEGDYPPPLRTIMSTSVLICFIRSLSSDSNLDWNPSKFCCFDEGSFSLFSAYFSSKML